MFEFAEVSQRTMPSIAIGQSHKSLLELKKLTTITVIFHGFAKIVTVHDKHLVIISKNHYHGAIIFTRLSNIIKTKCFGS